MDFLAPAYDLKRGRPHWFRSWVKDPKHDFRLAEVGQASASAPTYFPVSEISSRDGRKHYFADGGLFANNPAFQAVEEARLRYPEADEILLLSLGTGELDSMLPAERMGSWGLLSWLSPLIGILQSVNEAHQEAHVADEMEGHPYFRFDLKVSEKRPGLKIPSTALDLATKANFKRLDDLAAAWIESSELEIQHLVDLLHQPKTPAAAMQSVGS